MKIGILQTGHTPEELESVGTYPVLFEQLLGGQGFDFDSFTVVDGVFPESVTVCDGWLITGSRHGAYEDHAWIPPLEAFIRNAFAQQVPVVGVCFGHQIMAQAMGGRVEKFDGGWSVGAQDYEMLGARVRQNAWHQDQVVAVPEGAEVVARSDFCAAAGLVYPGRGFSVQWHPEFGADFVDGLIRYRSATVPELLVARARETLETPADNAVMAARIGRFFRERRLA